ncbi:GlxA family transcriptional regulator [Amphritea opalescens]|nr:helix-turn-helix domain-containing protein [Amphritea opalescens]
MEPVSISTLNQLRNPIKKQPLLNKAHIINKKTHSDSIKKGTKPHRFCFLVQSEFSASDLVATTHVLSLANRDSQENLYDWVIVSKGGISPSSYEGLGIQVDKDIQSVNLKEIDTLIIFGGQKIEYKDREIINWIISANSKKIKIGAIGSGVYLLALAGLLEGQPCTINREYLPAFKKTFPNIEISSNLFVQNEKIFCCSDRNGMVDFMLKIIINQHNPSLAMKINNQLNNQIIQDHQHPSHSINDENTPIKIKDIISLMESNLEEPLSMEDLSKYTGVSNRQIERLFNKHLKSSPSKYYLELRLTKAKSLIRHTNDTITDISISCGFNSVAHFSTSYRRLFGLQPREERSASIIFNH